MRLGLATPLAGLVRPSRPRHHQVLFRQGDALERLARVRHGVVRQDRHADHRRATNEPFRTASPKRTRRNSRCRLELARGQSATRFAKHRAFTDPQAPRSPKSNSMMPIPFFAQFAISPDAAWWASTRPACTRGPGQPAADGREGLDCPPALLEPVRDQLLVAAGHNAVRPSAGQARLAGCLHFPNNSGPRPSASD